jgi:hypothetical protein
LAITPDGPRGPRRHVTEGAIFLACHLGIAVVPIGIGYDRPIRAPTWDRFAIPRPWSKARCIVGPELRFPAGLGRMGLREGALQLQEALGQLTETAELWAAGRIEVAPSDPVSMSRWEGPWQRSGYSHRVIPSELICRTASCEVVRPAA